MRYLRTPVAIVAGVLLVAPVLAAAADAPETTTAQEPTNAVQPRLLGRPGAPGITELLDALAIGDDLVYIGYRAGRRMGLHWVDGSSGKDRRLARLTTGDFSPEVQALGEGVVFAGHTPRNGVEPWVSDGTKLGTRLLKDIAKGRQQNMCALRARGGGCGTHPAGSFPRHLVTMGGLVYFSTGDVLWRTDGTNAGTRRVRDFRRGERSGIRDLAPVEGELYFRIDDGRHGSELWKSDGTRSGTKRVTDLRPDKGSKVRSAPTKAGDHTYFTARTAAQRVELWRTDDTAAGAAIVKDIHPGAASSGPQDLTAVGDLLFFTANDGEHGRELWRSDGTDAGTALVKDIVSGHGRSWLRHLTSFAEAVYFIVSDGPDLGTWYRSDGTEAGTRPIAPEPGEAAIRGSWGFHPATAELDGRLYFAADDGIHGNEMWSTDGTEAGSEIVFDLWPGPESSNPEWLIATDHNLYFSADDGEHGRQLWQLAIP